MTPALLSAALKSPARRPARFIALLAALLFGAATAAPAMEIQFRLGDNEISLDLFEPDDLVSHVRQTLLDLSKEGEVLDLSAAIPNEEQFVDQVLDQFLEEAQVLFPNMDPVLLLDIAEWLARELFKVLLGDLDPELLLDYEFALYFNGTLLEDEHTLAFYNIENEDVLDLEFVFPGFEQELELREEELMQAMFARFEKYLVDRLELGRLEQQIARASSQMIRSTRNLRRAKNLAAVRRSDAQFKRAAARARSTTREMISTLVAVGESPAEIANEVRATNRVFARFRQAFARTKRFKTRSIRARAN